MDQEAAWALFWQTGLPQVYDLYCLLKEEKGQAPA
jgi:hypothetical protein